MQYMTDYGLKSWDAELFNSLDLLTTFHLNI